VTVLQLVERERNRLRRMHLLAGIALAAAATCAVLAFGVLALGGSRWLALPRPMPFLVWVVVFAVDGLIVWWTWRHLARAVSRAGVAAEIEREQALRAGALRGALEIADSGALGRRAAERLAKQLDGRSQLAPGAHRSALRRAGQTLAAALAAALLLGWAAPVFGDGLMAILLPVNAWRGTLLPKLAFRDLPTHVLRGEELSLDVLAPGRGSVVLSQRTTGEAWKSNTLRTAAGGVASTRIGPLRGDLTLVVSDGRSASDTVVVRVTDRPFVGAVSMRAIYPAYLGRPSEGLPIGEPARVPQGTTVELSGRASTMLSSIRLVGPDTVALRADGHAFSGRLGAKRSGRWNWAAVGATGPIVDLPLPLELEVVPDSAPRADIIQPTGDTAVAGQDRVALRLAASDDHGIASIELLSWRESALGERQPTVSQRITMQPSTVWSDVAELDLAPRDLRPGDALHVKVVAHDNSPWGQRGESRELLIKIPTMEERRSLARDAADSAVRAAQSAASDQRAVQKHADEAARDRRQSANRQNAESGESSAKGDDKGTMSYEAAEQAKAVAKEQREVVDRVKNLQKQAAALEEQLKAAGALDSALAQQLREAQELLRQALTPELLAQMQKLEQSAQQLQGDQSQQALKDLAAMQQRLREQLEKSAEMLKRAAYEGAMETLKDEAKEIADRERQLADSAAARSRREQRQDAERLADRSKRFAEDVQKLQERLQRDKAEAGKAKTEEASRRAESSEEKMRQLAGAERRQAGESPQERSGEAKAGESREQRAGDKQGAESRQQAAKSQEQKSGDAQAGKSQEQKSGDAQGAKSQEQKSGDAQGAKSQEQKSGDAQAGKSQEQKSGDAQAGKSQNSDKGTSQRQGKESGSKDSQSGQSPNSDRGTSQGQQSSSSAQQTASEAAEQMDRASQAMQDARDAQVKEWKQELTSELDRAVQEMLQMAREESAMEEKARSGQSKPEELRGQQSALKQGVDQTAQRLSEEGRKSSLLSGRSQRAVADAQQKVQQAMQALAEQRGSQAASSLGEAAESLNRAAASLARDRERANSASSASGFQEMLEQLQQLAKRQGSINSQAQGLMPMPGGQMSQEMQATARALARQQRQVAQRLEELGDAAGGDRAAQLAKEARQLAEALDGGRVDAATVARQQQLFRRLLDAGRTLEKDEREDGTKREAKAATGDERFTPTNDDAKGKDAQRFREPNWNELRGLTPEERRAILEYFKRINGQNP
jgi:hypothetical protein